MINLLAKIEHKIGEKTYSFLCPHDAPTTEVKTALCEFLAHVTSVEKAAAAQAAAAQPPVEAAPEVPVVEPSKVESING